MKRSHWRNLVGNPPTPRRSTVYCLFAVLTAITALAHALAQEPAPFIVLSLAGIGVVFLLAASLVQGKERRNESPKLDEFLRGSSVSEKYSVHYFVAMSTILTFNAMIVFIIDWSFGVLVAFPATLFGYLAYVSYRKKKSTIGQLN